MTRNGNHWELRRDPQVFQTVLGVLTAVSALGSFGEPQSFEGARQGVLGRCRLQPDDWNCSTIYVQVDLDRVAAS